MRLKLLLTIGACLMMSGCSSSKGGAGCVAYAGNAFTVDPVRDTSETVAGFSDLEAAMMGACE